MSWWVGKDRDAFNVALKEHTTRVMRKAPPVVRPPEPPAVIDVAPAEVTPAPVIAPPPVERSIPPPTRAPETCTCRGCGKTFIRKPLSAGQYCSRACYTNPRRPNRSRNATAVEPKPQQQPWRPGSRGRPPKIIRLAAACRDGILSLEETQNDPALGRAAVVMLCGFLLGEEPRLIGPWTGYPSKEVARITTNLRRYGVWGPKRTLACDWMHAVLSTKRLSKRKGWMADLNFWLDAMVANGVCTRETRDGEFYYGLVDWGVPRGTRRQLSETHGGD